MQCSGLPHFPDKQHSLLLKTGNERKNKLTVSHLEACERRNRLQYDNCLFCFYCSLGRKTSDLLYPAVVTDVFWRKRKQLFYHQLLSDLARSSDKKNE